MIAAEDLDRKAEKIAALIEARLGVGGRGLDAKLRRAGRLLPRWVRREAQRIVEAQRLAATGQPRLMMQTDPATVDKACEACERYLKSVDPKERRKDRLLGFLATNAFNLLIVVGAFIAYLVWAGHL